MCRSKWTLFTSNHFIVFTPPNHQHFQSTNICNFSFPDFFLISDETQFMFLGVHVYAAVETVIIARTNAASTVRADVICGVRIAAVNVWAYSRSGAKNKSNRSLCVEARTTSVFFRTSSTFTFSLPPAEERCFLVFKYFQRLISNQKKQTFFFSLRTWMKIANIYVYLNFIVAFNFPIYLTTQMKARMIWLEYSLNGQFSAYWNSIYQIV